MTRVNTYEPAHDKTYNKTCATSKYSDQPMHPRSLIRVFADGMCPLQSPSYPKRDEKKTCHTGWMYRLICVFAGHTGLIVGFFYALAQLQSPLVISNSKGPFETLRDIRTSTYQSCGIE